MLKVKLDNLCCANCANKINHKVSKIKYVDDVVLNFFTKTMYVELKEEDKENQVLDQIIDIVNGVEPDVIVKKI